MLPSFSAARRRRKRAEAVKSSPSRWRVCGCINRRSPILSEAMMEENNEWGDGFKSGNLIDTCETQEETGSTEDDSSSSLSSSLSAQR